MRKDFHLGNDSGGLSVVAVDAVPAIIEDARADDRAFVANHQAILMSLVGDDAPIVRIVVDEPLTDDEDAQWLARVRRTLVTPAGRIAVAGGFDPDVFADWQAAGAPAVEKEARVVAVTVPAGTWIVDVYTHADSMNGRHLLQDMGADHGGAGGWFRVSHPRQAFPLWLAHDLWFGGDGDPGHEAAWAKPAESVRAGTLEIAREPVGFVGVLIHLTPADGKVALARTPEDGWFDIDAGRRKLAAFPLGLASEVASKPLQELAAELRSPRRRG